MASALSESSGSVFPPAPAAAAAAAFVSVFSAALVVSETLHLSLFVVVVFVVFLRLKLELDSLELLESPGPPHAELISVVRMRTLLLSTCRLWLQFKIKF